jgi:hypothetical protein
MRRARLLLSAVMDLCIGTLPPGLALGLEVSAVYSRNVRLDGDGVSH